MSADDAPDEEGDSGSDGSGDRDAGGGTAADDETAGEGTSDVRDRIEEGADRAAEQIDESVVDLLAWVLDTETRARIYVELRQHPDSTSEEVADGTGLYPSTVREALAELHEEGKVERRKRESDGAGNNPYEYRAMAPTELVRETIGDVQRELNTVFNLDSYLGGDESEEEPVTINVEEESEVHDATGTSAEEDEGAGGTDDEDPSSDDREDATSNDDESSEDHENAANDDADDRGNDVE